MNIIKEHAHLDEETMENFKVESELTQEIVKILRTKVTHKIKYNDDLGQQSIEVQDRLFHIILDFKDCTIEISGLKEKFSIELENPKANAEYLANVILPHCYAPISHKQRRPGGGYDG